MTCFFSTLFFFFQILLSGLCLPFFGYISAWCMAKYFGRSYEDCLALSVETGVQNTGIAIFMLKFSLGQPEADLTTGRFKAFILLKCLEKLFTRFFTLHF